MHCKSAYSAPVSGEMQLFPATVQIFNIYQYKKAIAKIIEKITRKCVISGVVSVNKKTRATPTNPSHILCKIALLSLPYQHFFYGCPEFKCILHRLKVINGIPHHIQPVYDLLQWLHQFRPCGLHRKLQFFQLHLLR